MKANYYKLIENAVSEGVAFGLHRAFKHTECPTEDDLSMNLEREIMTAICEYLTFDELPD